MFELFPYQDRGSDWIARRSRCGLLDVPGLGKTAQIIRAIELRRLRRGVIVSPAHLRTNWMAEFDKFARLPHTMVKAFTAHDFAAWANGAYDILLLSYEMATRLAPAIEDHGEPLDFLAMDEAHYLANLGTGRTRALLGPHSDGAQGLVRWATQSWWITGSLLPNDPAQCYTFLRFCDATRLGYTAFVARYFHSRPTTYGQRNRPRPERLSELQALIANNAIRRTFADVGYELPPIHLTTTLVDGDTESIRLLLAQHPGLDDAIVHAVESGGLSFLDSQHVATLRRLIAEAKAIPYAEILLDELASDPERKVVVMGVSRRALQMVHEALTKRRIGAVLVQGGVSDKDKSAAIESFQTSPKCRVFIGNMIAAGTGLTLTAAAHIDVLEAHWAPAVNDQAIKRIRRIGQTREQRARFITLARSFDEIVQRVVVEKTRAIALVEGDSMLAPT